jgi:hypothetical protein
MTERLNEWNKVKKNREKKRKRKGGKERVKNQREGEKER